MAAAELLIKHQDNQKLHIKSVPHDKIVAIHGNIKSQSLRRWSQNDIFLHCNYLHSVNSDFDCIVFFDKAPWQKTSFSVIKEFDLFVFSLRQRNIKSDARLLQRLELNQEQRSTKLLAPCDRSREIKNLPHEKAAVKMMATK